MIIYLNFKTKNRTERDLVRAILQVIDTMIYLRNELAAYEIFVRIIGTRDVQRLRLNPAYNRLIKLVPNGNFEYATNGIYSEKI